VLVLLITDTCSSLRVPWLWMAPPCECPLSASKSALPVSNDTFDSDSEAWACTSKMRVLFSPSMNVERIPAPMMVTGAWPKMSRSPLDRSDGPVASAPGGIVR